MMSGSSEGRFTLIQGPEMDTNRAFRDDVRSGLLARSKRMSCRFLYDDRGSKLFEEICTQPEYYPTRVEASILERVAPKIVSTIDAPPHLIELGSGSAEKTRFLIEALIERHGSLVFEPIDISRAALEESAAGLLEQFPGLIVRAIAAEYITGLELLAQEAGSSESPRLVAWLGSSIGNFERRDAVTFLGALRQSLLPADRILLGIDLRKDAAVLNAAYDDAAGTTGRFIKNLLVRINRELGGNFDLECFRYQARYDEEQGAVEMSLICERPCQVMIPELGLDIHFTAGESIHMEDSYKYSATEIEALARDAGFLVQECWEDDRHYFREVLLEPQPEPGS